MTDDLERRVVALEKVAHALVDQGDVAISIFNQLTAEMRADHERRVSDLLDANNIDVSRRRVAELRLAEARTIIGLLLDKIVRGGS